MKPNNDEINHADSRIRQKAKKANGEKTGPRMNNAIIITRIVLMEVYPRLANAIPKTYSVGRIFLVR
jgi:hypothetical protein